VPAYQLFSSTELLGRDGAGTDAGGGSTRRYPVALEPVGLLAADLSGLKLVALMIDGVHFADICVWLPRHRHRRHQTSVGGGTGVDREHHRGSLPADRVRERGLDTTRPTLAVLDGAKALAAAVGEVFDHPVIQRCQLHKIRNVSDYLPKNLQAGVERRMRTTYHAESAVAAQAQLDALAAELPNPSRRRQEPPRRADRHLDRARTPGGAHPGPHHAQHQRHRIDELDLPQPCPQRHSLARRSDGAALVRRRHDPGCPAVPPGQRLQTPGQPAHRPRTTYRQAQLHQERRLMITRAAAEVPRESGQPPSQSPTEVTTGQAAPRRPRRCTGVSELDHHIQEVTPVDVLQWERRATLDGPTLPGLLARRPFADARSGNVRRLT
jgi:putative transposase